MDKTSNLPSRKKSGFAEEMCVRFWGLKNANQALPERVKQAYISDLRSLSVVQATGRRMTDCIKKNERLYQKATYSPAQRVLEKLTLF